MANIPKRPRCRRQGETDDRPALALPLPSRRRLRVRNHGAVVGAPVPPRIVSAFAALETRRMLSTENPLWGAPRIHGELLKLGFEVAETTVYKAEDRHPRAGGHSCATMRRRLLRLISACADVPFPVRRNQRFAITDLAREEGVHVPHPRHLTAYYASRR